MSSQLLTLSFGIGAMILATGHAFGQTNGQPGRNCGQRDFVLERLADRYGESRQSIGLGADNQVVEVFASLETGTWTITVTSPAGTTCLVASGQSFETLSEAAAVPSGEAL